MTREEAKELLPIIQAYAEGKTIQVITVEGRWKDLDCPAFVKQVADYRIKPESKYRPFNSQEECWQEMQKHQPFGWIKKNGNYVNITLISKESSYNLDLKNFTFADGQPFGIKEK